MSGYPRPDADVAELGEREQDPAGGRARQVRGRGHLGQRHGRPAGRNAAITSRPRASASMKSGPAPARGMANPSRVRGTAHPDTADTGPRLTESSRGYHRTDSVRHDGRPGGQHGGSTHGRPVVLRGGTVLTMDDAARCCPTPTSWSSATGSPPSARPRRCRRAPSRSTRPAASSCPGMIDTHRHMWQTAMRGYGADWTLTQYFVWYYLESGRHFRPRGRARGQPARRAGGARRGRHHLRRLVARAADRDHAEAAVDALRSVPGRFVLAYGNIQQAPVGVDGHARVPGVRRAGDRRRRRARLPAGVRRDRRPGVPREARRSRSPASSASR